MSLTIRTVGDVTVLCPKGMYLGGRETRELETKLDELLRAGTRKVLINLAETDYLSSPPLNVLLSARPRFLESRGQVKLCAPNRKVNLVFVTARLGLAFDIFETEHEALSKFESQDPSAATAV
jgi:anti-anti-sigma factor